MTLYTIIRFELKKKEREREGEKKREKKREKVGPRRRGNMEKAFHLALATFADIICLCLTFHKQQE